MKALSIRQPWAWLIVHGYKDVENRTWRTKFRGRFLVHASAARGPAIPFEQICARVRAEFHLELPACFEMGGIVGEAEITDCVTACGSAWFSRPFGFVLRGAIPLPFEACKGRLGFWEHRPPGIEPSSHSSLRPEVPRQRRS